MKTTCLKNECGSVLIGVMIFVLAIAGFLYMYLWMVQNSDQQVARAQTWNAALPIAEAGIEEGMAELNTTVGITQSNTVGGFYSTLSHNINSGTYYVNFYDPSDRYLISTGTVTAPITGNLISRAVKVVVQREALFSKGLVALNNITMNGGGSGNNVASDSWNSQDPTESLNGKYNGYQGYKGDIASVNGFVNLGNQTIYGSLYLGPNASYNNSGTVTGTTYTDANLQYPDAALPTDSNGNLIVPTPAPTPVVIGSGKSAFNAHDFTTSGYYAVYDSTAIVVEPGVNVSIDVKPSGWSPASLDINGGTTNSGNVVLYVESGSITLAGNSTGGASANRPANLYVFGLPAVTSITFSGSSTFVGVIYAPEAVAKFNGGGNSFNFIGSMVVNTFTMGGHFNIHYDTSLALQYFGVYIVGSWQEL